MSSKEILQQQNKENEVVTTTKNQKIAAYGKNHGAFGLSVSHGRATVKSAPPYPKPKTFHNLTRKRELLSRNESTTQTLIPLLSSVRIKHRNKKKKKEMVVEVDAGDNEDELAVVEYIEDLHKYYKLSENEFRPRYYIGWQPEFNELVRAYVIDWLIDIHDSFELAMETLYLTVYIVDRYLTLKTIKLDDLNLIGLSAMVIASKYETTSGPKVDDFVKVAYEEYSRQKILIMEKKILQELEWNLTVTTPYMFLVRYIKVSGSISGMHEKRTENMFYFLGEIGLVSCLGRRYCPSMIAASVVFVGRCCMDHKPYWNETLKMHTGYSEDELMKCIRLIVELQWLVCENKMMHTLCQKYYDLNKCRVSIVTPSEYLISKFN